MDAYSYKNPSFSSTLLDAIYRSIDEGDENLVVYSETMRKKLNGQNLKSDVCFKDYDEMEEFQRVCMIEKWIEEKKNCQKAGRVRRSLGDFVPKVKSNPQVFFSNSSWSSSDSSSGGGFSSSETESVLSRPESRTSLVHSCYGRRRPKPISTGVSTQYERSNQLGKELNMYHEDYALETKSNHDHQGKFVKTTKSRALKIYSELKKAKQPISPGGKLANFLNSLLGNAKKAKSSERKSKSTSASTCSSASSFSRSCLSKTPSSRGGKSSNNGIKRSVRFYPISVIVDEDCQPCGHKNLHEEEEEKSIAMEGVKDMRNSINEELKFVLMDKNLRVEEAARDLLRNYQKRVEFEYDFRTPHVKSQAFDEDEDDDAASYASSDLFELDNLSAIGNIERYREELPVYETTRLGTNRAIANAMIL